MKPPTTECARVRRITIDERLDEGLLKIAVADLLTGREDLSDDPLDAWSDERLVLINRENFMRRFDLDINDAVLGTLIGAPGSEVDEDDPVGAFWRTLEEGQVYLVGEIAVESADSGGSVRILVRPGASTVQRIDRIEAIKKKHEGLYSRALLNGS